MEANLEDIRWSLVPYTRGFGLEVSPGQEGRLFPHFIKINANMPARALDDLHLVASQSCDFVVVELEKGLTGEMLEEWWRVIKQNGHLCLLQKPELEMETLGGFDQLCDGPIWVYRKLTGIQGHRYSCRAEKPQRTCLVVRHGAFGDMLQLSSVFPGLKAQGYHIIVNTTPRGQETVRYDPHVDEWLIVDTDQIPPGNLQDYWQWLSKRYTKFINFSESVEGTLLPASDRPTFYWPHAVRHQRMNVNYVEFQHAIAEVPYDGCESKFYPSSEEKNWAMRQAQKTSRPIILWSLAGSGPHKVWPFMDEVIARILVTYPKAAIFLCGDKNCQMLEEPWRNESRVHRTSGLWSIRETLAFASWADVIIGPETGVLNGMAMEDNPKVCLLSHSSHENLTRDWKNTWAVFSTKTKCYPCHQLHKNFQYCPQDEVYGVAMCQAELPSDSVWLAVQEAFEERKVA